MNSFFEDVRNYLNGQINQTDFVSSVEKNVKENSYHNPLKDINKVAHLAEKSEPSDVLKLIEGLDILIYTRNPQESGVPAYSRGSLFLKDRYTKVTKTSWFALETLHHIALCAPQRKVDTDVVTGEKNKWGGNEYTDFLKDFYAKHIDVDRYLHYGKSMEYAISKDLERVYQMIPAQERTFEPKELASNHISENTVHNTMQEFISSKKTYS
ncbi:MAG: hypothetical protein IJ870_01390 [Alphaproteobacteria bacterium]|nr:hypothetical protein [Alphaproteobacteria bacterium]